jgi:serine protease Do
LRRVAEDLIENQATDHKAWIGVHMAAGLTPDVMESRGIRGGVLITRVFNGTPADHAGLSAGDVVIGVDGFDVNATSDLAQALRTGEPGDEITIRYSRLVPPDSSNITKNDPEAYEPQTFLAVVTLGAQPIV